MAHRPGPNTPVPRGSWRAVTGQHRLSRVHKSGRYGGCMGHRTRSICSILHVDFLERRQREVDSRTGPNGPGLRNNRLPQNKSPVRRHVAGKIHQLGACSARLGPSSQAPPSARRCRLSGFGRHRMVFPLIKPSLFLIAACDPRRAERGSATRTRLYFVGYVTATLKRPQHAGSQPRNRFYAASLELSRLSALGRVSRRPLAVDALHSERIWS
jgi:hypothetical protein